MEDESTASDLDDDRLSRAVVSWYEALARGEVPDVEVICGDDGVLAARLWTAIELERAAVDRLSDSDTHDLHDAHDPHRASSASSLLPGADDASPRRLGDYRLVREIGIGGMGRVYLAEQESLGRIVAVKVLDAHALRDPHARLRFRREAEITAALDHPNIVPVYELGEDDGHMFIAMKWLTGPALDAPTDGQLFEPRRAASITSDIARALHAAHCSGVVHRDVKPANILLDSDVPYIVDFGLARADTDVATTREGVVAGTLAYLAPEQLRRGSAGHDPRTDIYALGVTLYQIVTGRLPFRDHGDARRFARDVVLRDPMTMALSGTRRDLEIIVLRALEKEPDRRFATAEELADELDRFTQGEPIHSKHVGRWRRLARFLRRRPRVALALLAVASVVIGFIVVAMIRTREANVRFEERATSAREAFDAGRFHTARTMVARLRAERPDHAAARDLARCVRRRDAWDRLLDHVQDAPTVASNPARLQNIVKEFVESGASTIDPRTAELALAMAETLLGDSSAALVRLDDLESRPAPIGGSGRAASALRALARRRPITAHPTTTARSADEYVFAALALRADERDAEEVDREIRAALDIEPSHGRALLTRGIVHFDEGRFREASTIFGALVARNEARPLVRRYLAHASLMLGRLDVAAGTIARIRPSDHDSMVSVIEAEIEARRGRGERAHAILEDELARHPNDVKLRLVLASHEFSRGRVSVARRLLNEALEATRNHRHRESAEAGLLIVRYADLVGREAERRIDLDASTHEELRDLREDAEDLRGRARFRFARAQAGLVEAWVAHQFGKSEMALMRLEECLAVAPEYHRPRAALIHIVNGRPRLDAMTSARRRRVQAVGGRLIEAERRGHAPPTASDIGVAHLLLARLADLDRDGEAFLFHAAAMRGRLNRDVMNQIAAWLDGRVEIYRRMKK